MSTGDGNRFRAFPELRGARGSGAARREPVHGSGISDREPRPENLSLAVRLQGVFIAIVERELMLPRPMIGRPRTELDPPGHTFRYFVAMKLFIIVYEPAATGIRVARILHGMRNLAAELARDAGDDGRRLQR